MGKWNTEKWDIEYVEGGARCADCGRWANYRVIKDGYRFYICRDCIAEYEKEENEDEVTK